MVDMDAWKQYCMLCLPLIGLHARDRGKNSFTIAGWSAWSSVLKGGTQQQQRDLVAPEQDLELDLAVPYAPFA